jgi:RNA polymerase sigma factor (sigma-70 family)
LTINQYNQCVQQHADALYRFIIKTINNLPDAEDIIQSAYEKFWANKDIVILETAKSYLFTIAYNKMIDYIKFKQKTTLIANFNEEQMSQTKTYYNYELKTQLELAFNNLDAKQRMLIMLKDYEGYSYKEIGEIVQLNESQVKVYLHRARLILKKSILNLETV